MPLPEEPIRYEYEIIHVPTGHSEKVLIYKMVEEGYRLIAVAPDYSGNSLYFERPKQQ